ncbi:DMT family transporter [Myxosarcina sp. GI1(2024)]
MTFVPEFIGELAALSAAFLWAVASIVYTRLGAKISPLRLNAYKGVIAIALLILTLFWQKATINQLALYPTVMLSLSGIIGIGLGDTAYFAALNNLGARRTLLLETLSPPIGALLALVFIGERLTVSAWCGILLTLGGIIWVISERIPLTFQQHTRLRLGIIWAVLAAITQAFGAVISRFALLYSNISPLSSATIRLIAGTAVVWLLLLATESKQNHSPQPQLSQRNWSAVAIAAFGGTYLGIWLQQISLKFSPTGIAQTLLATSPLFILPLVALMGEKVSLRAILGVLVSLAGVAFLFVDVI